MRKWKESETGSFYSEHRLVPYLGSLEPQYHIVEDSGKWMIGQFYGYTGEYAPLEDENLSFISSEEAKNYVDNIILKGSNKVSCRCCGKDTYMGTFGPYCHIDCYLKARKTHNDSN